MAVAALATVSVGCAVNSRVALPPLPTVAVFDLLAAILPTGSSGASYGPTTVSTSLTTSGTGTVSACQFVSPVSAVPGTSVVPAGLQINVGTPPGGAANTGCTITGVIGDSNGNGVIDAGEGVAPGTYTFTVRAADSSSPPQSDTQTYTIIVSSLQITVSDSPDPTVTGQSVTITWTFTVSGSAAMPNQQALVELLGPTSMVEDSCVAALTALGCGPLNSTTAGAHTVRLTYPNPPGMDPNFPGTTTTSTPHTVNVAPTTTTVTTAPDPSVTGEVYAANVIVATNAPGGGAPTGTVAVSDGLGNSCNATLTPAGNQSTGTCNLNAPAAGARTVTASYPGDANYAASMDTDPHTVNLAPTTTTITSDLPDPSVTGEAYTVNWTVTVNAPGAGTPTGTVTVDDGTGAMCSAAVGAGSCVITSVTAGPKTLTANYSGDANFAASSDTEAHTVNLASTTTTVTSDAPDPSLTGETYTVNATVDATAPAMGQPTGTVTVNDGQGQNCVITLAPGPGPNQSTGSCMLTSMSTAVTQLTANYAGDANFAASSDTEAHTVTLAPTSTSLVSSANPSVSGQTVTFTATVAPVPPAGGTPTGTVNFRNSITMVSIAGCNAVALTAGSATCMAAFTVAQSPQSIEAIYSGDANFATSTSALLLQTVLPANTTTTLMSSVNPSVSGENVTFTATVAPVAPGAGTPTGNVQFLVSGSPFGAPVALVGGVATSVTTTFTVVGSPRTVDATYLGSTEFNLSNATPLSQVTNQANSTVIVTAPALPTVTGETYTVNVTVGATAPGGGTPTGMVTINDGTGGSCSIVALVAGMGNCMITSITAGAKTLTANYGGDSEFAAGSGTAGHTVNLAPTTTMIAGDAPDPTVVGETFTVNWTVTVNAPGAVVAPTVLGGTVTVRDAANPADSCTAAVGAGGLGSCMLMLSNVGARNLEAVYSGDANFATSTSAQEPHTVNLGSTTTALMSSVNPSVSGETVTFTATVTAVLPATGTPTGTVNFRNSITMVSLTGCGAVALTAGSATCMQAFGASQSPQSIEAVYSGNASFATSTSAVVVQAINAANTTTTITMDTPDPSGPAANYTVTVVVDVVAPGGGNPTGMVAVSDNDTNPVPVTCNAVLGPGPGANQSSGSCMLASNPAATPTVLNLTANYPGDGNYSGSADIAEAHTVDVVMIAPIALGDGVESRMVGTGSAGLSGVRFPITGGTPPYVCTDPGGTLPTGVSVVTAVTGTDCELQGSPGGGTGGNNFMVNITVTDQNGAGMSDTTGAISWDIRAPLMITDPTGLADAVEDRNYAFTFDSTMLGGIPGYTWSEMSSSLGAGGCAGFAINAAGDLTGSQPLVGGGGTCNFTVQVMDSASTTTMAGTATQAETITVQPMLAIVTSDLTNAKRGNTYLPVSLGGAAGTGGDVIQSAGGTGTPVTYTVTSGPFVNMGGVWTGSGACAGLMFNETGFDAGSGAALDTVVNGTATTAGTCTFTVEVNDNGSGATGPDPTPPSTTFDIIILDTFAYVANSGTNTLSVINTDTNQFVTDISLAGVPNQVAISPDGRGVFVSLTAAEQIAVVDASTNTVFGTFSIGANCDQPEGLAATDPGTGVIRVFVACSGTDGATGERVATFDFDPSGGAPGTFTFVAAADVDTGGGTQSPQRLAVTLDGSTVYATVDHGVGSNGSWSRINATTGALIDTEAFGQGPVDDCDQPRGIAIAQTAFTGNPEEAYVACLGQDETAIITVATNSQPVSNLALTGTGANSVAFTPNGARAYVTMNGSDEVEVIDTAARTATNVNLPTPGSAPSNVNPVGVTVPDAGSIEVFIALSGTVASAAPGVAILNDAASPTAGTNNTINPASSPAYPAASSPQGIAHIPIPR